MTIENTMPTKHLKDRGSYKLLVMQKWFIQDISNFAGIVTQ